MTSRSYYKIVSYIDSIFTTLSGMVFKSKPCLNTILTSGTLSPVNPFEYELVIKIRIKLENEHIINNNQILLNNITALKPYLNNRLLCKYPNMINKKYLTNNWNISYNYLNTA